VKRPVFAILLAVVVSLVGVSGAFGWSSATPALYDNCTKFNKRYPHGVGKVGARDRTKSGDRVRTFLRSNRIYRLAMHYNDDLDRDGDGIACEKK